MTSRRSLWILLFLLGGAAPGWSQGPAAMLPLPLSESKPSFVSYDLRLLLSDQDGQTADIAPVMKLIQRFVAPDSWETTGGAGRIFGINGSLLVYQNKSAHLEIGALVNILRRAANFSQQVAGQPQFYGDALRAFPHHNHQPTDPYAQVYPLGDLPGDIQFTSDRELADPAAGKRSLIELLKAATPADSWEEQGGVGSLIDLPAANCLIIVQTSSQHQQLGEMLTALRSNRERIGLLNPLEYRIVEYSLIDKQGQLLSTAKLRDVAIRLQADLPNLGWRSRDRFIIADQALTISQSIEGHAVIQRTFAEWELHTVSILPPDLVDAGSESHTPHNRPRIKRVPDPGPPQPLFDPQPMPEAGSTSGDRPIPND